MSFIVRASGCIIVAHCTRFVPFVCGAPVLSILFTRVPLANLEPILLLNPSGGFIICGTQLSIPWSRLFHAYFKPISGPSSPVNEPLLIGRPKAASVNSGRPSFTNHSGALFAKQTFPIANNDYEMIDPALQSETG